MLLSRMESGIGIMPSEASLQSNGRINKLQRHPRNREVCCVLRQGIGTTLLLTAELFGVNFLEQRTTAAYVLGHV
jgi:hypothetical protein